MTATRKTYTEAEITQAVRNYADHHGIEPRQVDVSRNREMDGAIIGFRLAIGVGKSTGTDERFGEF